MDDTLFERIYSLLSQSEALEEGETEENVLYSCILKSGFTHQLLSFYDWKHCVITSHFREFRNALLRALWSLFVIGDATVVMLC